MKKAMALLCLAVTLIASTQELYAGRYFVPEMARWATPDPALRDKLPNDLVQIQDGKLLSTSPYVYAYDNPLKYTDPDGKIPIVVGALSGAALDIGLQVATNYFQGRPLTDISWKQVAISAGAGAVGAGLASKAGKFAFLLKLGSKADEVANVADDVARGAANLADDAGKATTQIAGEAVKEGTSLVDDAAKLATDFLGKDARVITNKAGDKIFVSKDGLRRVRFDINRPNPHKNPHAHVEEFINGKWQSARAYPKDVLPE